MNQSSILSEFRARFHHSSITESCSGEGCNVDMVDIPSDRVIVNLENEFGLLKKTEKRCDRLLFFLSPNSRNVAAVPIELKSGKAKESEVKEKLENSLLFIQQITPISLRSHIVYFPVLFEGRGIKWSDPKGRKQLKVSFRGKLLQVLIGRCGRPRNLAGVLFG